LTPWFACFYIGNRVGSAAFRDRRSKNIEGRMAYSDNRKTAEPAADEFGERAGGRRYGGPPISPGNSTMHR